MKRRLLAALAALAAIGGAAAIVVLTATGGGNGRLAPPAGDPVSLETAVSPGRLLFGDRAIAELRLTVDESRVDPADAVVAAFFRPFRRVGPIAVDRVDLGPTSVVTYRYPIQCIDRTCIPEGGDESVTLPIGLVRFTPRQGDVVSLPLTWPDVSIATRLSAEQERELRDRPGALLLDGATSDPPPVAYGTSPTLVGWLMAGAAALIVLVLGGLAVRKLAIRRARPAVAEPAAPALPPLEAALAAVGRAEAEPDRRTALDELSRLLADTERPALSRDARRLAWSQGGPQVADVERLVSEVRRSLGEAA